MSDLQYLYAVMAGFYLWECTHWIRNPSAPFVAWVGHTFCRSQPFFVASGRDGGLHLASPLPWFGTFFVTNPGSLAISPVGVANCDGMMIGFSGQPRFTARRHRLRVDGQPFAAVGSAAEARQLAHALNTLVRTPEDKREGLILARLCAALDSPAIVGRLGGFRNATRFTGILAPAILVFVFLVAPLVIWQWGLMLAWPWLLGGLAVLCFANSIGFFRAHKELHPELDDERFAHFLMVLLFPPAAMRTRDLLSRPLLESFHPLAAARELCGPDYFKMIARHLTRELNHPPARSPAFSADAGMVWQWHDRAARKAAKEFVEGNHLGWDQLLAPPAQVDADSHSYCPRCHAQFTTARETCSDCGLVLVPF